MGVIRRQGISTSVFMAAGLLLGFVNSIWLYPKLVGVETLGLVQWLFASLSLATLVGSLGLDKIIIRFFPYYENKQGQFLSFVLLYALVGIGLAILGLFVLKPLVLQSFASEGSSAIAEQYYYLLYFGVFFCS